MEKILDYAKKRMDVISAGIATCHKKLLSDFFEKYYDEKMELTNESFAALELYVELEKSNLDMKTIFGGQFPFPFPFPFPNPFPNPIPPISLEALRMHDKISQNLSESDYIRCICGDAVAKINDKLFDFDTILEIIEKIYVISDAYIKDSTSFEDFKEKMTTIFEDLSKKITYYPNYLFARIYFDIFISSLEFWPNIIIGNSTTKAASFWDKVKDEWNNRIKPILNEDSCNGILGALGGAASGAAIGAIAGGVGALPGAAVGAVGGAISSSVIASARMGMDLYK